MELKKEMKMDAYAVKFVFEENGRTLGRAYLYIIHNDLHDRPYGLLEDLFVKEDQRGKGLGNKLVKEIIEEAKKRHCTKLIGTSRYARTEVHVWYEKLGFKDYGKEFRMDF
ncbi:GNAT family N-acetyltransferase [Candidatus Parcubacteria bacterium]|jgi:GNAT superfamily N-acetyltransferase|nr:GNAT family N-acetyltransferase [Candidatus Parcubacteria bacterium]MBT3949344.1 GNAT family N-acetyltransferase [Candidatus Parcubacteria bacterium]